MRAYVGVTDGTWLQHLAAVGADEANFWRPAGDRLFKALTSGEPFFFKTHYPNNRVAGGGFFNGFAALTIAEAWEIYGEANGAATLGEMRAAVGGYRAVPLAPTDNPKIGCILLRDVRLFDEPLPAPSDFARSIVQGKTYPLASPVVTPYFERLLGVRVQIDDSVTWHRPGPTYGDPRLSPHRLGQRAFQGVVRDAYKYRCAVTGDRIRPVLQAAHIKPLPLGGEHRLDNGLLLRSDVHTLFDAGYLGIDPSYRLVVSPRLRDEFEGGAEFYERMRSGGPVSVPDRQVDRPAKEFLEWHLAEVFLRS